MPATPCRFCGTALEHSVVDLGMSPLCESYLPADALDKRENFYPLHVKVCQACFLVQVGEYVQAEEIFTEYAYFSSFSTAWLKHAEEYVNMISERLSLGPQSLVIELASNDGYLLQYFNKRGIPSLGIEPAANVAKAARDRGVETEVAFFGAEYARELRAAGRQADLVLGNNVLAQVPDLNSFVAGIPEILKPQGTATFEFPHLMTLFEGNQFDTIYHEHFCYFSLLSIEAIFARHGLTVFDVEELWTHGGSLRIYACHGAAARPATARLLELREREEKKGYRKLETYTRFEEQVRETKRRLLKLLIELKSSGKTIVGYGAPGKGNTLLNYCGIRTDFLDFTVDRNPYKQGKFLPGTHIPILEPGRLDAARPDYILILPWNFKDEILAQLAYARDWGARFIVPVPEATVV
ncbi:MAG TPA: class I SAM-dependent methyltransferase [Polyangiaceae bacterium]|jgi:SAM-dependent methyltransferase|nr:class I SAM-dependent methyltransferase [Polyangiaceae bacterium]